MALNLLGQTVAAIVGSLVAIEGFSYRWTHPTPAPHQEVRLAKLPSRDPIAVSGKLVNLPDVYQQSAPKLRCTSGEVYYRELDDGTRLNLAFFEWQRTDAGSVLEAFRHMPEVCLGSVGMKLVSKEPSVHFQVEGQTITFDHTVFQDPGQGGEQVIGTPLVHSFRGIWVAGMVNADARGTIQGDAVERLRAIRFKCAADRFRPPYACVIQGAIRGTISSEAAWEAFEKTMLQGMTFEGKR